MSFLGVSYYKISPYHGFYFPCSVSVRGFVGGMSVGRVCFVRTGIMGILVVVF